MSTPSTLPLFRFDWYINDVLSAQTHCQVCIPHVVSKALLDSQNVVLFDGVRLIQSQMRHCETFNATVGKPF